MAALINPLLGLSRSSGSAQTSTPDYRTKAQAEYQQALDALHALPYTEGGPGDKHRALDFATDLDASEAAALGYYPSDYGGTWDAPRERFSVPATVPALKPAPSPWWSDVPAWQWASAAAAVLLVFLWPRGGLS